MIEIHYEYAGVPPDDESRPFCRLHYGEVRRLEEWTELRNGFNNEHYPVVNVENGLRMPGGKRCRHYLRAVVVNVPDIEHKTANSMDIVTKTATMERLHGESGEFLISGTFTTNALDSDGERIVVTPEAWEKSIPAFLQSSGAVMVDHGQGEYGTAIVGRVRSIEYEPQNYTVNLDSSVINEPLSAKCIIEITDKRLQKEIEDKKYSGFSWSMKPHTMTVKRGTSELICHEMQIMEITVTGIPANQHTQFTRIKTGMQQIWDKLRKTSAVATGDVSLEDVRVLVGEMETLQKTMGELRNENERLKTEAQAAQVQHERHAALREASGVVERLLKGGKILPAQKTDVMSAILNAGDGRGAVIAAFERMPQKTGRLFTQMVRKSSAPPSGKKLHLKYAAVPRETMSLHERVQKYARENKTSYTDAYRIVTKTR